MIARKDMKTLQIRWQRLVDNKGETCVRCGATETAVEDAVRKLKLSLEKLDIDVALEKISLDSATFKKDPLQSNRIWIAGKPLEDWLSATNGASACSAACGDSDCRTLTVDGRTYESIPSGLIVKAGLIAGAQLLDVAPETGCRPAACTPQRTQGCCPSSSSCGK
jgi:hypothetical protein